jgi:FKBP-type peptidyl-prolyl cis-trans isomerase FklB
MKLVTLSIFASLLLGIAGCKSQSSKTASVELKTELDSVSYCLGQYIAKSEKSQGMKEINAEALAMAFNDVFKGSDTRITDEESQRILNNFFKNLQASKYEDQIKKGKDFLEENKKKDGVVVLPSGLQYKILKEGKGPKPSPNDKVKVHYTGKTIDGKVFDSSVDRGEPITFGVSEVIPGWTEALQLMPVGSKWELYIPSDLAYGARGSSPVIEPYATLIFEVELLSIEK